MYAKGYDTDGTLISVTANPKHRPRRIQTGAWERLLCVECEARLSRLEAYAKGLLDHVDAVPYQGQLFTEVEYDYSTFKLFGLSLIWRSHVAERWEYQRFTLGPLAEDLRCMLLAEDPGAPRMCPFIALRYVGSQTASNTVTTPTLVKRNGERVAVFDAYGYSWIFVTSRRSHTIPSTFPLVGFTPNLQVPSLPTTDRGYRRQIRRRLPNHVWEV